MNSMGPLIRALIEGMMLGMLFFGGLWWTVRHGLVARNPVLWFGLSALARMGIAFTALYWVARSGLMSLLTCLLGLLVARLAVTHFTRALRLAHLTS
jgi:F1F0 ATPase subunit 2